MDKICYFVYGHEIENLRNEAAAYGGVGDPSYMWKAESICFSRPLPDKFVQIGDRYFELISSYAEITKEAFDYRLKKLEGEI
jgi:hypothetical protein